MRQLARYLSTDFLVICLMTVLVFTFVMCIGVVIRAIDYASLGISGGFIGKLFLYNIPYMLSFTIPMGVLTGVLLLFGRLSFDGELTAMKACGLNLWQVVSPIIILAGIASLLCVYINAYVSPLCKHLTRQLMAEVGVKEPMKFIEPGRLIREFPGLLLVVGDRDGSRVEDIVVYELDDAGNPTRNVRAGYGDIDVDEEARVMMIDLYEVFIDQRDGGQGAAKSHYINAEFYPVRLDYSRFNNKRITKKPSDMTLMELITGIEDVHLNYPGITDEEVLTKARTRMIIEVNKRMALSMSCFGFALLGVPLGMRSRRKESSLGIGVALLLVFMFYLFIIIADSLVGSPQYHPGLITWIPVFGAQLAGFVMIRRIR